MFIYYLLKLSDMILSSRRYTVSRNSENGSLKSELKFKQSVMLND